MDEIEEDTVQSVKGKDVKEIIKTFNANKNTELLNSVFPENKEYFKRLMNDPIEKMTSQENFWFESSVHLERDGW